MVVLRNQSDAAVIDGFWVDLYLNPIPPPDQVNQIWNDLSEWGVVWGVTGNGLPLPPGGSLSLQVGDGFYAPTFSLLPDLLPAGAILYIQVDSYNLESNFGGVLEGHEARHERYNNIFGPYTLSQSVELPSPAQRAQGEESPTGSGLPQRMPVSQ